MSVAEQLQRTPRGRLKYDRHRVSLQSIEDVLDEIRSDMASLQVRVVVPRSPPGCPPSPPSFGLPSPESEAGTPLHPRVARMTCHGPWSPRAGGGSASPVTRGTSDEGTATLDRGGKGTGESQATSPDAGRKTVDGTGLMTPERNSVRDIQRNIEDSFERSGEQDDGQSGKRDVEENADQSVERSQNQSLTRSGSADRSGSVAGDTPRTSTPREGSPPTPFTPRAFEKLLHDERQRYLEEAKAAARARLAAAEETVRRLREQHALRQRQLAAEQLLRGRQLSRRRCEERERREGRLREQQEDIRQQQREDAKDLSERVRAAVQQQRADEEERRQRAARQRAKLDHMVALQRQMRAVVAQVFNSIKSCADRSRLQSGSAASRVERLKQLVAVMDRLTAAPPAELGVEEAERTVAEATELGEQVTAAVDEINSAAAAKETPSAEKAAGGDGPSAPAPAPAAAAAAGQSTVEAGALGDSALQEDAERYAQLQRRAAQFRAQFDGLIADPALKKFKFDCQKAVNTPINAISPVSTAHLRDKLDRLRQLLRGRPVQVTGGQVTAAAHPQGVNFCLDLVAKKFVRQGEDVVSSKPEAAFALAAVLLALQAEFPALGELTLAHCQARCPYLVPMYLAQMDGDTNEQYYRKLGYDYQDGVVEKQDKFLKRMSGIARLYAALLVARPPQTAPAPAPATGAETRQPGVKELWHWLAATVNLEPRADVTASLLHDVLEVGGSTLSALYGGQFVKLVRLVGSRYLPRVQQVTPSGCGGPVVRLEQQLQRIISTGRVPPPHGELRLHNW